MNIFPPYRYDFPSLAVDKSPAGCYNHHKDQSLLLRIKRSPMMKQIILYDSATGNTEYLAKALSHALPNVHAVQSGPWTARKPSWSIWVSGRTRAPAPTVCGLFSPHWQASRSFSSAPPALVRIRRIFLRSSAALRVNSPRTAP